jgi:uncharacterized membrane protein
MISTPLPWRRLALWASLILPAYAPLYLIGTRPGMGGFAVWAGAMALAALVVVLLARTEILDRLAAMIEPHAGKLLTIAVLAYVAVSVMRARARLAAFGNYDQAALFGQSFWTLLRGHPFANTLETVDGSLGSHLGVHFSPTLLALAPLYAILPRPITLLAAQALVVALAAVPLYHLLRREAGRAGALFFSFALLAIPNFWWAGVRDFHDSNFLPVLLLTAFWALENRRPGVFVLAAIAALGVREETGLTLVMLSGYALLRGHGVRAALGMAALGVLWMVAVITFVMPRFWSPGLWIDPARFFSDVFGQWGPTPLAAAQAMLTHPVALLRALVNLDTVKYVCYLLSPLLLLPPFTDLVWVVGLPNLGVNLLSRLPWMRTAVLYYSLVPITFFALATVQGAARMCWLAPIARRATFGLALGIVVLAGALPSLPLSAILSDYPAPPAGPASTVVKLLPSEAALYAPISLYPALCNRESFGCWESLKERAFEPDMRGMYEYIVLWPEGYPPSPARDRPLADSLAADPRFARLEGHDPFLVYRRK